MPTFAPKLHRPSAASTGASRAAASSLALPPSAIAATDTATRCFDLSRVPPLPIQRKPSIGAPDDAFEREADSVAEQVMRMAQPTPLSTAPLALRRKCACDDEQPTIRMEDLNAIAEAPSEW